MWRAYTPATVTVLSQGKFYECPVTSVKAYSKNALPENCPIRSDLVAVELVTDRGSRWYGMDHAFIDGSLRMVCERAENRDEVLAQWEAYVPPASLDAFLKGYIECALWSSNDESRDDGGDPLDSKYSAADLAPEALESMRSDCQSFYGDFRSLWADDIADEDAGHDFWLTRNGHGSGFWDRDIANGDLLSKHARKFGEVYLCVGDDNRIHV
jgi:hypothetical protein